MNSAGTPSITKRAFNCPHCSAFSGHGWNRAFFTDFKGTGVPYATANAVAMAGAQPHAEPYRKYVNDMVRGDLPFVASGHTSLQGLELFNAAFSVCTACSKLAFWIGETMVYPAAMARTQAPPEVPAHLAGDFNEAGAVLSLSPKASAALSRRCLQSLLREQNFNQKDLAPAIDALLASRILPSVLADNVDSIRNVGNFAAHPQKDTNSGAIIDVEPHEAEWNLEVLEGLFDFFYVGPAKDAQRRTAYNAKLALAGKPAMKS